MDYENSKNPSSEEMEKIENQHSLHDGLLLIGGAEYAIDDKGNKTLELTADQMDAAKKEMDASRMNESMENSKKLEELQDLAKAGSYEEALKMSQNLKGLEWLAKSLYQNVAAIAVENGEVDVAMEIANSSGEYKNNVLDVVAQTLSRMGLMEKAMSVIDDMEASHARENSLRCVLPELAKQNPESAQKYLEAIHGDATRVLAQAGMQLGRKVGGKVEIDSNDREILKEIYLQGSVVEEAGEKEANATEEEEPEKQAQNSKNKDANSRNEQAKERLEGEELFQNQIENNSHPNAKELQENMILFIRSIDKGIGKPNDFQLLKEELSELLYRCGVEYVEGRETEIDGKDTGILQPILDFRKEMDGWNTLSEARISDFRKRLVVYMDDAFGMEVQQLSEGEDYKKKAKVAKVEETKNEFLNDKIKKVLSPGFKINENLFSYYEKWYATKKQEMQNKWKQLDGTVSRQEFDKVRNEDDAWLKKYSLKKVVKQAEVEVYRYKA